MTIEELIEKKHNSQKLTREEIEFFVKGVCDRSIKDEDTIKMLHAIHDKDIDYDETYNLTMAMARSGKMLDLSNIGECVDKHSTGGVSDTTSIVLVPILASLGLKVAKMSGRSLGFTGGTVDKMEVFKGYRTEISTDEFKSLVAKNGASIISQSAEFALADKIIYKLRSDSDTVDNIGLISSSIMSKKIACGAKIILLDVKYGSGAFMKSLEDAKKLAKTMVEIGKRQGIKVRAVLSNMEQPLTQYIGNNLEVYSAIRVLTGKQNNLYRLSKFLCSQVLLMTGFAKTIEEAGELVDEAISSKKALNKLKQIVEGQGGDTFYIDNPRELYPTCNRLEIYSSDDGFVEDINTTILGKISHDIQKVDGVVKRQDDVGLILRKYIGDEVEIGESLVTVFYKNVDDLNQIKDELQSAFKIGQNKVEIKLIDEVIG